MTISTMMPARMKRATATVMLAILTLLLGAMPAGAQGGDMIYVWQNDAAQTVIMATPIMTASATEASTMVRMVDGAFVEENLGMAVVKEERLGTNALRDVNASAGSMYGVITDEGAGIVTILAVDATVWIFLAFAMDSAPGGIDADAYLAIMEGCTSVGPERTKAPAGYTASVQRGDPMGGP